MPFPFSIVVAYTRATRAIGHRTGLPWPRLSTDLQRFAQLTTPHTVVMGRKTFDSPEVGGQALPRRRNVVLTRNPRWIPPPGVVRASDWTDALLLAHHGFGGAGYDDGEYVSSPEECRDPPRHVFVVGGESLYRAALLHPSCNWVYATEVGADFKGDTFFPSLPPDWHEVPPEQCPHGWASNQVFVDNDVPYSFRTFKRVRTPGIRPVPPLSTSPSPTR